MNIKFLQHPTVYSMKTNVPEELNVKFTNSMFGELLGNALHTNATKLTMYGTYYVVARVSTEKRNLTNNNFTQGGMVLRKRNIWIWWCNSSLF